MADANTAVRDMSNIVLQVIVYALVIGSIAGSAVFATITLINVTEITENYGLALAAIVGFLTVAGTIVGILFFWKYAKSLLSKDGVGSMTA